MKICMVQYKPYIHLSIQTRRRIVKIYIWVVVLYESGLLYKPRDGEGVGGRSNVLVQVAVGNIMNRKTSKQGSATENGSGKRTVDEN